MSFAKLYLLNQISENDNNQASISFEDISLNEKVDKFIDWYTDNVVNDHYLGIGLYNKPKEMRNFIEKMAVWYELRYPDVSVDSELFNFDNSSYVNDVMFQKNEYVNDLFSEDSDVRNLDWKSLYNFDVFVNSLAYEEKKLLDDPNYTEVVYLDGRIPHFHLSLDGIIQRSVGVAYFSKSKVEDEELVGMNVEDAVKLIESRGIQLPDYSIVKSEIENYNRKIYQKEELLNCVMYRIIERGGSIMGPHRALLFAKEFNRDVDTIMKYGMDTTDPDLAYFINECIKLGGSNDLDCYKDYFSLSTRKGNINLVNVNDIVEKEKVKQLTKN